MEITLSSSLPASPLDSARLADGGCVLPLRHLSGLQALPTHRSGISDLSALYASSVPESEAEGKMDEDYHGNDDDGDSDGDAFLPYSPQRYVVMSPSSSGLQRHH
jgi:hypothetical protein